MPAGSPLSSRIAAALLRWVRLLRLPRVLPLLLVAAAVAVVTIGAPMVSGVVTSFTDPVAFESAATPAGEPPAPTASGGSSSSSGSSSGAAADAPLVQLGVDGAPSPETPAPASVPPPGTAPTVATPPEVVPAPVDPATPAVEAPEPEVVPAAPGTGPAPAAQPPAPAPAVEAPVAQPRPEPAPVVRAAPADPSSEGQVLALVNDARAAAGCPAVAADGALAAVARAHSADMRDRDYFSHTSPEGLSPFDRAERAGVSYSRAENIAYGQADAAAVMDAWMDSPGHRANILDCDLTKLGVGVALGPGGPWWTQLFGS